MWIHFTADMDWKPTAGVTVAYKAGWTGNVPRAAADKAVAAGKGVRLKAPRKGEVATDAET